MSFLARFNPFRPPTIEEIANQDVLAASLTSQQAAQVILHHQYVKHLADAQIEAISAWHSKYKEPT